MSSCYDWIDPFEERDRAVRAARQAASAREDGRQDVLRFVAERTEGDFRRALDHAVAALAERLSEQTLKPFVRENFDAYQAARAAAEERTSLMMDMMRPAIAYVHANGEYRLDMKERYDADEQVLVVSYEPAAPRLQSQHVSLSAMSWR